MNRAAPAPDPQADEAAVRTLVQRYAQSIDAADTDLAAEIWLATDDALFIHPRGENRGFGAITQNFYAKTMGANFSQRKLTVNDDAVDVSIVGDTAIVYFQWRFNATRADDGGGHGQYGDVEAREAEIRHRDNHHQHQQS